jgi:hypothetical protein
MPNSFQILQEQFGKANVDEIVRSGVTEKEILSKLRERSSDLRERREKIKFTPSKKPKGIELHFPEEALTKGEEQPSEEILPEETTTRSTTHPKLKKKKGKPLFDRNSFNVAERTRLLLSEFLVNTTYNDTIMTVWNEHRSPIIATTFSLFSILSLTLASQRYEIPFMKIQLQLNKSTTQRKSKPKFDNFFSKFFS